MKTSRRVIATAAPVLSRMRPPISNKLLGTSIVNFQFPRPFRRKLRLLRLRCSTMGHFFVVPWLTPSRPTLLGMAVVAILVFGLSAILKATSSGRQAPAKELITGSIPRAAAVRKSLPNDPMVAFLGPASTQLTPQAMQNMVVDRRAVPLPRPRPKRL